VVVLFSNAAIFRSRLQPQMERLTKTMSAEFTVVLTRFNQQAAQIIELENLLLHGHIKEVISLPNFKSGSGGIDRQTATPLAELRFWIRNFKALRSKKFELCMVHTLDSISYVFLDYFVCAGDVPRVVVVPNLLTSDFIMKRKFRKELESRSILHRFQSLGLKMTVKKVVARCSSALAWGTLLAMVAFRTGKLIRKPVTIFDGTANRFITDNPLSAAELEKAGIPSNLISSVAFESRQQGIVASQSQILLILGSEPLPGLEREFSLALSSWLNFLCVKFSPSRIRVRLHPDAQSGANLSTIEKISARQKNVLIDDQSKSLGDEVRASKAVFGVASSGIIEATLIPTAIPVFGLSDLNRLIGYPQLDIPRVVWLVRTPPPTGSSFLEKYKSSYPPKAPRRGEKLEDVLAKML